MKRFFMLAAAACAVVFMGCSKDDEGTAEIWQECGLTHLNQMEKPMQ